MLCITTVTRFGWVAGQLVARIQRVMGVEFIYQPPPKNRVPYAAALKIPATKPCDQFSILHCAGTPCCQGAPIRAEL